MLNGDGNAAGMGMIPQAREGSIRAGGLLAAWRRTRGHVAVVVLAIVIAFWWLTMVAFGTPLDWAFDFRQFWQGGRDVVQGVSPYATSEMLDTARVEYDARHVQEDYRFPYPAGAAVALAPLGALSFEVAAAVWGLLLIAAILGALWILEVRDWRVYAVTVTSAPVITSVRLGTLTPVLLLLAAATWRFRDRRWAVAGALAAALSLKLFLWPLLVWLIATRRFVSAALTCVLAALLTLGAWALIGFEGLTRYPEFLRRLAEFADTVGLSFVALGDQLGLPIGAARILPFAVGIPLLVAAALAARRDDGDRRAFSLAVVAAIAITPIVWLHYFALLVVPLAILRPRLAWLWGVMWMFWLIPSQGNEGHPERVAIALACAAVILAASSLATSQRVRG